MSLVAVLAAMACSDPEASNVGSPEPASPVVSDSSRDSAGAANRVTTFAPKPIDPELVKALEEPSVIERDDAKPFNPSVIRMKDNEATMAQEILDLPESDARELALTELMRQWSQYDLEGALKFGWEKTEGEIQAKRAFLKGVMPEMAKRDPQGLLEVVEEGHWWPDQWKDQREALRRIERNDFDRASEFFKNTGEGKQHKEEAYRYTSRIGREQGYQAAIAYAEAMKKQIAKAYATRAAVTQWVEADSVGASNYVNQCRNPELRDHGILGLIDGIWQTNPRESVVWAKSINHPDLRDTALRQLAKRWSDPEYAGNLKLLPRAYSTPN
ncbi:MAG: hypothetical protein KDN19_09545 [Verrucomicrobiae bacterium]|nr:hypothetical protein [Verrucomicrobiae bacterium]